MAAGTLLSVATGDNSWTTARPFPAGSGCWKRSGGGGVRDRGAPRTLAAREMGDDHV